MILILKQVRRKKNNQAKQNRPKKYQKQLNKQQKIQIKENQLRLLTQLAILAKKKRNLKVLKKLKNLLLMMIVIFHLINFDKII